MFYAFLSALCLTLAVIYDRLMMEDVYGNNPHVAITVSVGLGTIFGLILTVVLQATYGVFEMVTLAVAWFIPYGVLTVLAGFLTSQVLYLYLIAYSRDIESTVIAIWLAALPIFLLPAKALIMEMIDINLDPTSFTSQIMTGVLIATVGMIALERVEKHKDKPSVQWVLIAMNCVNVVYLLILEWVILNGSESLLISKEETTLAFMPYYWIGFLFGIWPMAQAANWKSLKKDKTNIMPYLKTILFLEVLGSGVYFFEFSGLAEVEPVILSVLIGAHVIAVWTGSVYLGWYGVKLTRNCHETGTVLGLKIKTKSLLDFHKMRKSRLTQLGWATVALGGIALVL